VFEKYPYMQKEYSLLEYILADILGQLRLFFVLSSVVMLGILYVSLILNYELNFVRVFFIPVICSSLLCFYRWLTDEYLN